MSIYFEILEETVCSHCGYCGGMMPNGSFEYQCPYCGSEGTLLDFDDLDDPEEEEE